CSIFRIAVDWQLSHCIVCTATRVRLYEWSCGLWSERCHAEPKLLSTYQTERRPVAWFVAEHSMTGPGTAILDNSPMNEKASEFFPIVGYLYRSPAIVSDEDLSLLGNEITLLDSPELTGTPGTRVPHVWLQRASRRIST